MNEKQDIDEDLEEELDVAFSASEKKKNVFQIMRDENESVENKEQRTKNKFKP